MNAEEHETAAHGREVATREAAVTRSLSITEIVIDDALQVRAKIDGGTVNRYADAMRVGVVFPPIKVVRINGAYVLIDGWHRIAAATSAGHTVIEAEAVPVEDFETAGWLAAAANLSHGLPLKRAERRKVFRAYVSARQYRKGRTGNRIKSAREISAELGGLVVHRTVLDWMKQDAPRVYELMRREENSTLKRKERRDPDDTFVSIATGAIEQALNSFSGIKDPAKRGELIAQVRGAAATMEASGPWVEPPPLEEEDGDFAF